jgi:chemotaxis protein methyltransferase CheR
MKNKLSQQTLAGLSGFVKENLGLRFTKETYLDLERGLNAAARELGFNRSGELAEVILTGTLTAAQTEILANNLTIGETYFFRERITFNALEHKILPDLLKEKQDSNRRISILSAGCATGEEPYSISILLNRLLPDINEWNIKIAAVDLNQRFIEKAIRGEYSQWSFRNTPRWLKPNYFVKIENGLFKLNANIKKYVSFHRINLTSDDAGKLLLNYLPFDLIFCRNVLMYLDKELQDKVVKNFDAWLNAESWLIVSVTEISHIIFSNFKPVAINDAVLYQKTNLQPFNLNRDFREPSFEEYLPGSYEYPEEPNDRNDIQIEELDSIDDAAKLYLNGDIDTAAEIISNYLLDNINSSKAYALFAKIEANRGNLKSALNYCGKAIVHDKLNYSHYLLNSTILQELGEFEEALKSLKQTIFLEPNSILAYVALGNLSYLTGKETESSKYFSNAMELLANYQPNDLIPDSEGMTAGRLHEIVKDTLEKLNA